MTEKGIPYKELDVSEDRVNRKEMVDRSGQWGVPVIDIDGELIVGFNQTKIKEKLGIKD